MNTTIYLASVEPLWDEGIYNRLYEMSSNARKAKTDRFRFRKDKILSVGAEALLRHALRELGIPWEEPVYSYGENMKPYLAWQEGIFFNISHAGEYVMLAVSDAEVGCDIEKIGPVSPGVARLTLSPEERQRLAACDEAGKELLFCRYWVLKESYLKATGEGLYRDPASLRIELDSPAYVVRDGAPQEYGFWEGDSLPGYRMAVCRAGDYRESLCGGWIFENTIEEFD